jgi:hypothetical protein
MTNVEGIVVLVVVFLLQIAQRFAPELRQLRFLLFDGAFVHTLHLFVLDKLNFGAAVFVKLFALGRFVVTRYTRVLGLVKLLIIIIISVIGDAVSAFFKV